MSMNKKGITLAILALVSGLVVQAQEIQLVRSLARPFARGGKAFAVGVGNYKLSIPNVARQVANADLIHDYFTSFSGLNAQRYPKLTAQNNIQTWKSFQNFTVHARQFQSEFPRLTANVQTEICAGHLDYTKWLPDDPGIIYLGEVHEIDNVKREVVSFLRQLANQHPQKPIVVATEFLSFDPHISLPENLISDREEFDFYFDQGKKAANIEVLEELVSIPNIYLIGLENETVLQRILTRPDDKITPEEYFDFMQTYAGMNLRNRLWARTLTQLQELAPDALIVAYGGIAHFSLHEDGAVPSLVPGKHFIIQLATPDTLPYLNPLTASLSISEPSLHMFEKNPLSKIAVGWKTPSPDYRPLIGNDLSVIVHD